MLPILATLACAGTVATWPPAEKQTPSYLFTIQLKADKQIDSQREVYEPHAGDLVLLDNHSELWTRIFKLAGTDGPRHAGIIYRREDGSLGVLEAGGREFKVESVEVDKRLREYDGTVLIRRLKSPLSAEQAQKLTEFCAKQEGKPYALGRLALQLTPIRPRGYLAPLFARTSLDRDRWICSELVTASLTAASLLNAKDYHANAIFPRDLCYDENADFSKLYHPVALWYPRDHLDVLDGAIRVAPAP